MGDVIYFQADDGVHGEELYKYDLSTQTSSLVANINAYEVKAFDNKIYFNAQNGTGGSDRFLYVHDPSDNSTQLLVDNMNDDLRNPHDMYEYNGYIYMSGEFDYNDAEFGRYNIAANEFELIANINPDGEGSPSNIIEVNGQIWFSAYDGQSQSNLWRYDPTTGVVENIIYQSQTGEFPNIYPQSYFDGKFFFQGYKLGEGSELYVYDLGSNTLLDFPEIYAGAGSSSPSGFMESDGKLFFSARTNTEGRELRVYNPVTDEVSIVADIFSGNDSSSPGDLIVINGKLYFSGIDSNVGYGILSYDDATGLISPTSFITPNSIGHISGMIAYNGKLYFGGDTDDFGNELYVYNPADDSWGLTQDINPTGDSHPERFFVYQNELYFQANDGVNGVELWKYNTAASLVEDILRVFRKVCHAGGFPFKVRV